MEWKQNDQLADRLLGLIAEDMKLNKPIPHVTELIHCLTQSWMDRFEPLPLTSKETCLFSIGVGLGEILLVTHKQEVGGVEEGIHYSIDFMSEDAAGSPTDNPFETERLGELKSTRMGLKKNPLDFPDTWRKQLLAYMKTAGSLHATYAVMYVIPAEFRAWEVSATQEEIDENWTWLQARKVIYMDYVRRGVRPTPFEFNEPWMCKTCRYHLPCNAYVLENHPDTDEEGIAAAEALMITLDQREKDND